MTTPDHFDDNRSQTASVDAAPATAVPSALDQSDLGRRAWKGAASVLAALIAITVIAGFFVETSYVGLLPGSARDTEDLVDVSGTEVYPSDGELLFTTVKFRTRPNVWEYLWIQLDDDAELVPEELILGNRTPDENRDANLALMTESKDVAVAVALEELGYDAITPAGVGVVQLVEESAAIGVLEPGDIIIGLDGDPIATATELVDALGALAPGDEVVLRVIPAGTPPLATGGPDHGEAADVAVVLGAKDDDPTAAFLGVAPQTVVEFADLDPGFDVEIDSGSVGGPSAGLAFTLAILDELTPGELTGGGTVAVTGTINVDGTVGAVGGVEQKVAAVRDQGIDVFIVPAAQGEDELRRVRDRAGDRVEVVAVSTLDEALAALAELGGNVGALEEFAAARP